MNIKEIPGSLNFTINKSGEVFDGKGIKKKTYKNGDGYITVSIKLSDRRWITFGVHRLLALAFLDKTYEQTEVNHKDSNIVNNDLSNLEWVTARQNNIHSEIMRKDNQYPTLYCSKNNEYVGIFKNAFEAANVTKISIDNIWSSIKESKEINGFTFKHKGFSDAIPKELHKQKTFLKNKDGSPLYKPIKTLDIDTGAVLFFNSLNETARYFKVAPSHIFQSIQVGNKVRVFKKKYQICYQNCDFPIISKEDFDKAKNHGPRKVIGYNVIENKFYIANSAKEFINEFKLSKKAITTVLAKNILKTIDNWIVIYYTPDNREKLKNYITSPVVI